MGGDSLEGGPDACEMNRTDLEGSQLGRTALEGSRENQNNRRSTRSLDTGRQVVC